MLKYTTLYTLLILLRAHSTNAKFIPLKAIPVPDQEIIIDPIADQLYKEKYLKEQRTKRFLASIKEEDIPLLEEAFNQAPVEIKALVSKILQNPESTTHYRELLLTGPSGSGKSTLARAIAYKLGRKVIFITGPSLLGHFRDQAAEKVAKKFKEWSNDIDKPVMIIDEINALTDDHTSEHSDAKHTAMQLWTLIDEYSKDKDFLLIGTTNVTKKMPHQLQSRFLGKTFCIKNPSTDALLRAFVFRIKQLQLTLDESCTNTYLSELVSKTSNFSRRDIQAFIERTLLLQYIKNPDAPLILNKDCLEQALVDLNQEKTALWDFSEQTTDDERRHRETLEQNAKQFSESQDMQLKLAEWAMLYQALIKPIENPGAAGLTWQKLVTQLNFSKSIVFPTKKTAAKIKTIPWTKFGGLVWGEDKVLDVNEIFNTNI